ncbi:MAG TPA: AvrD family protein [Pseudonocardiaceae bacterium]|jgi:hypothetical protein|nr:AvrD family protein [Pseudonocardiaceae bacterium]
MPETTAPQKSVDDYLGPGGQRFFSAGYRRVGYLFGNITAETIDARTGVLTTGIRLTYPSDWSRKVSRGALRPHLSTIDAILLAAQLGELYLTHAHRLDERARRAMWVRKLRIRAGSSPDEELDALTISVRPVSMRPDATGAGSTVVLDGRIGGMRTRCEIAGVTGSPHGHTAAYRDPSQLLGPAENRYYGTGFTRRGHRLEDLALDIADRSATASVSYTSDGAGIGDAGLGSAYQPAPTMIDLFATSLQLAQILLYETDSMHRGDSNTLWMRDTELTVDGPQETSQDGLRDGMSLYTALRELDLLTMNGAHWRTADIHGRLGPIALRCAVAHALPADQLPAPSSLLSASAEIR